jgi:hypothetical protein
VAGHNYYRSQVAHLPKAETYAIQIQTRGDGKSGATKWMNITPDQLARITEILAEQE